MDIVFDGDLRTVAHHDPEGGEVQLVTLGVDDEGFGAELGEDAYLAVDGDGAFAQLALRGPMAELALDQPADAALLRPEELPQADLAEARWALEGPPPEWRLDGGRLLVIVPGTVRSQWARIGATSLCVALDLEGGGRAAGDEALVAGLIHLEVLRDPGLRALGERLAAGAD